MIQSVYRLDTGIYCGCTANAEQYDTEVFGITTQTPPEYDEFTQQAYYVDGAWEIRDAG